MDKNNYKYKMSNQTEFVFDETLSTGFTTVYNEILMDTRLSDSAIGLYCRIVRFRNIPNWKINQGTLAHENNKRGKVESAMKELISADYVIKEQLRNEKGHMCGVKYIIFSKSKSFGMVDNTEVEPNAEKPKTDKPISDKLQLKIKNTKNKDITNKDTSSSKGKTTASIHSLVESFNASICELKKTTTTKFMKYVEKYDNKFIEAVITYCEAQGAKSYSYFEKTIESYIAKGVVTEADMEVAIDSFRNENKTKKNNAIRSKEINKAKEEKVIDELIGHCDVEEKIEVVNDEVGCNIKALIEPKVSEVSFKTWIANLTIEKNNDTIVVGCPNSFTKEIINKKYMHLLINVMEDNQLGKEIKLAVVK